MSSYAKCTKLPTILSMIWQSIIYQLCLHCCICMCEYVCDQPPPTLALLIKVLSIVTHSNANSGTLTHTYDTPPGQVVSHVKILVTSFDLWQKSLGLRWCGFSRSKVRLINQEVNSPLANVYLGLLRIRIVLNCKEFNSPLVKSVLVLFKIK